MSKVNELIEQIGGRKRLEEMGKNILESRDAKPSEVKVMARALLAVLDAQENPSAWIINCNSARINFVETEKTSVDKIIEGCREDGTDIDITPLYTTPPAASGPRAGWLAAAVNRLLDVDGSRGKFSAIRRSDALEEVERLLATAPAPGGEK